MLPYTTKINDKETIKSFLAKTSFLYPLLQKHQKTSSFLMFPWYDKKKSKSIDIDIFVIDIDIYIFVIDLLLIKV